MDPHSILLCVGLCCWIWVEKRHTSSSQYLQKVQRDQHHDPIFAAGAAVRKMLLFVRSSHVKPFRVSPSASNELIPIVLYASLKTHTHHSWPGAEEGKPWDHRFFVCGYVSSMGPRITGMPRGTVSPIQCKTSRPRHYANSHFWMREIVPSFQASLLSPRFDWHRELSLRGKYALEVKWDLYIPDPHTYGLVSPLFSVKCVFNACVLISWGNPCL